MRQIREQVKTELWFEYGQTVKDYEKGDLSEIEATQDFATDKALQFTVNDKHYWFPKSQVSSIVDPDGVCHYYAPKWMLRQKGLL